MAGEPTHPTVFATRPNVHGASLPPEGMENALDEERAASMADEGGCAGMHAEAQPVFTIASTRHAPWSLWAGVAALAGLFGYATWRLVRR